MAETRSKGYSPAPASLRTWLQSEIQLCEPLTFDVLPGGLSNVSTKVEDALGRTVVLRRGPAGSVAHDVMRECRIIQSLTSTAVPVPTVLGSCEDEHVNGDPFFVMDWVEGVALKHAQECEGFLDRRARARVGPNLILAMAVLHDQDSQHNSFFQSVARKDYVSRQLRRWAHSWPDPSVPTYARAMRFHSLLSASTPEPARQTILHGDYGLHNVMLGPDGSVSAILDWELATVGDPLADLAYLINAWATEPGEIFEHVSPSELEGFVSKEALIDVYSSATGFEVQDIGFYRAFAYWKVAAILEGVVARASHRGEPDDDSARVLRARIDQNLRQAEGQLAQ